MERTSCHATVIFSDRLAHQPYGEKETGARKRHAKGIMVSYQSPRLATDQTVVGSQNHPYRDLKGPALSPSILIYVRT